MENTTEENKAEQEGMPQDNKPVSKGYKSVEKEIGIEKRICDEIMPITSKKPVEMFIGVDFLKEVELQLRKASYRKRNYCAILVKSHGFHTLRNLLKDHPYGRVLELGDTSRHKIFYKNIPIYNISDPHEETSVKIENLNYIKVVYSLEEE